MLDDGTRCRAVIQCVNRSSLTQNKAEHDMQRMLSSPSKIDALKFVTRGAVSAMRRDAIQTFAKANGIKNLSIWSGVEFEEHLRLIGEDLLRRFCAGEVFPDRADELLRFADDLSALQMAMPLLRWQPHSIVLHFEHRSSKSVRYRRFSRPLKIPSPR
ncbi:hypothetical protein [Mesorhizobium sp. M0816]|uniref:hypothetical protein n=1 Tax=Mesorhizobium sp. M0816 TaxID=2957006 RepID=UPI00333B539F